MFDFYHVLLLLHIGGAVVGFGPTFAFGMMTPMMEKAPPEGSMWIYETLVAINDRMVWPALIIQPITGVWLVFKTHRNEIFFQQEWLWISTVLYVGLFAIAVFIDRPRSHRLLHMVRAGRTNEPAYRAQRKAQDLLGMFMGFIVVAILILMVMKPGA